MLDFIISAVTDKGIVKSVNQDSYTLRLYNTSYGKMIFAVLCDGMGGLSSGEVASATVVNSFAKWADKRLPEICKNEIQNGIISSEWLMLAYECNRKIYEYGRMYGESLGTTATALLITQKKYYIMNVGDTRVYEISNKVTQLTKDQSVIAREIELGNITVEQAKYDSRRNVLLQSIGATNNVFPDMYFGDVKEDSVYILCSDGFIHEITNEEIYTALLPAEMTDNCIMKKRSEELIEINKNRKEKDNITVLAIKTINY